MEARNHAKQHMSMLDNRVHVHPQRLKAPGFPEVRTGEGAQKERFQADHRQSGKQALRCRPTTAREGWMGAFTCVAKDRPLSQLCWQEIVSTYICVRRCVGTHTRSHSAPSSGNKAVLPRIVPGQQEPWRMLPVHQSEAYRLSDHPYKLRDFSLQTWQ